MACSLDFFPTSISSLWPTLAGFVPAKPMLQNTDIALLETSLNRCLKRSVKFQRAHSMVLFKHTDVGTEGIYFFTDPFHTPVV